MSAAQLLDIFVVRPQPGNYTDLTGVRVLFWVLLGWTQVRDEYAHFLSRICTSQKKRYSDFSSTNPSSSQSQVSSAELAPCCLQNEPSFCCLTSFLFVLVLSGFQERPAHKTIANMKHFIL